MATRRRQRVAAELAAAWEEEPALIEAALVTCLDDLESQILADWRWWLCSDSSPVKWMLEAQLKVLQSRRKREAAR